MQSTHYNYFADELDKLRPQIAQLDSRLEHVSSRCAELRDKVRRRDWVLSGRRPTGEDIVDGGGKNATIAARRHLSDELREAEKDARLVRRELDDLRNRAGEFRAVVERQYQDALTPGDLDADLHAAEGAVTDHDAARLTLLDELAGVNELRLQVHRDLSAEAEARVALDEARSAAYLAPADKTAARAVNDAELTLAHTAEVAAAARSAAGRIDVDHAEAVEALARHDRSAAELARRLEGVRAARAMLVARDSTRAAERFMASTERGDVPSSEGVESLGQALIALLAAVPDRGERLLNVWRDGLKGVADGFERELARSVHPYVSGRTTM